MDYFVYNASDSPLQFRGSDTIFGIGTAKIVGEEELARIRKESALFKDCEKKGLIIVSDEMKMEWLPLSEQLTLLNKKNLELELDNKRLADKVNSLTKELSELTGKIGDTTKPKKK